MKTVVGTRPVVNIVVLVTAVVGVLLLAGAFDAAFAQVGPFGAPRPQAPAVPIGGVLGWIFAKQAEFYRQFSSLIRAAKADGNAALACRSASYSVAFRLSCGCSSFFLKSAAA